MTQVDVVTRRKGGELAAGAHAMAPMLVAFAPFGLLVGAAVAASESPAAAWLSTWTIYGGAAHLAVLDVLQRDTGVLGAALVGLLINARMVAYSVSLAPYWRESSVGSRVAAAAVLTDATWALAHNRAEATARARRRFYFGAGVTLWFGWPALVTLGVVVGRVLLRRQQNEGVGAHHLFQRLDRTNRNQVARTEDRIKRYASLLQCKCGFVTFFFRGFCIDLQLRVYR